MIDLTNLPLAPFIIIALTYFMTNSLKGTFNIKGDAVHLLAMGIALFWSLFVEFTIHGTRIPSGLDKVGWAVLYGLIYGILARFTKFIEKALRSRNLPTYADLGDESTTTSVTVATPAATVPTVSTTGADRPAMTEPVIATVTANSTDEEDETHLQLPPPRDRSQPDPALASTPEITINRV